MSWLDELSEPVKSSAAGWLDELSAPVAKKKEAKTEDSSYDMSEYGETIGRLTNKAKALAKSLLGDDKNSAVEKLTNPRTGAVGVGEAAANVASSMVAAPLGGLAGLATTAYSGDAAEGARTAQRIQHGMTYEPRTPAGQLASEVVAAPLSLLSEGAGWAGGKIGRALGGDEGEAIGRTAGEALPAAAAAVAGGTAALRARPGMPKGVEAEAAVKAEAVSRAEAKTAQAGIDWAKLPLAARKQLADMAANALEFDKLSPDMIRRAARLQELPVPIAATKGQLTRDPVQLGEEQQLAKTRQGSRIEARYQEQNKALLDNFNAVEGDYGALQKTPEQVGSKVVEALSAKQKLAKTRVDRLYDAANKSVESEKAVSPQPLIDLVRDHPNQADLQWVIGRLKRQQVVTGADELAQPMASRDITLRELQEIRKAAEKQTQRNLGAEVKARIDEMSDGVGGEKYAAARDAYKAYKSEFANQGAVRQLLSNKGDKYSQDRQVALEDVFTKTVVGGSIQDLRNVTKSLIEVEDPGTRKLGRQAVNELAAQTVRYIRDEAAAGPIDQTGLPNISAAKLRQAVDRIGDEKLDLLLGKTSAEQLRKIAAATEDVKTSPPNRYGGSATAVNFLNWMDKFIGHVPYVGAGAKLVSKLGQKAHEAVRADALQSQALLEDQYLSQYRLSDQRELKAFLPGAAAATTSEVRR
jgi:hypothetical protein